MEFGVVKRVTEGLFRYQGWPTVAKDEKGVLYVGASGHRLGHVCPFGKDYLYISRDEGKSWEGPIIANDSPFDDRDAGLWAWGDGQLVLTWFVNPKKLYHDRLETEPGLASPMARAAVAMWDDLEYEAGSFLRISKDGGKSWSEKRKVPVSSPHGPCRRADGSLLYLGKESGAGDPETYIPGNIYAVESRDEGRTWQKLGRVEFPEGFDRNTIHEPHAVELPDGTILGAVRISGKGLAWTNGVAITRSEDGGKTFSQPQVLDSNGTPPHFLLHSSGAVVLTYGRRAKPCGERARISWDGGKTWGEEIVISEEAPTWDLGYPSSVELSDGSILTVYYQRYPGDDFTSVLQTKWELPAKE